jgi:hypothetical protein
MGTHTVSMLNKDLICLDCKSAEKKIKQYKFASEEERRNVKAGNYNYEGYFYGCQPYVTQNSKNASIYYQNITNTFNYIMSTYSSAVGRQKLFESIKRIGLTGEKLFNSKNFSQLCMGLATESVYGVSNSKVVCGCHRFAGAVTAVLELLGEPHQTYMGYAIPRNSKNYRIDKADAVCGGEKFMNHCWVVTKDGNIIEYFNGFKPSVDYICWLEVH